MTSICIETIAFEQAYVGVRDEARGVYRIAKGYATIPEGDAIRTHVADLKRLFSKPRRKKVVPPPVVLPPGVEPADGVQPVKK